MASVNLTEKLVQINLPPEPQACAELQDLNEKVSQKCDFDVIIDLSMLEIITSASISNLLILHNWLQGAGRTLVLYGLRFTTKCIFNVAGLNNFFKFTDNKTNAISEI
jgi:anti-anti-sigma regulatory factor